MLAWKKSSNKISKSQREQVWTSSTILFQISNFDSKLHLKRRYFLLKKKKLLNLSLQTPPENDIANQFLIDNSKYGKDNTVINEAKEIYYQSILGEMVWPLNLM